MWPQEPGDAQLLACGRPRAGLGRRCGVGAHTCSGSMELEGQKLPAMHIETRAQARAMRREFKAFTCATLLLSCSCRKKAAKVGRLRYARSFTSSKRGDRDGSAASTVHCVQCRTVSLFRS